MTFYQERVLPHLINCACGMKAIARQREKVVPKASGIVLELGAGSGLNLPYYKTDNVDKLIALEPSQGMRDKAHSNVVDSELMIEWVSAGCEDIPLENASIDSAVLTYTLCTVDDPAQSLAEIWRVLRPQGRLYFSEHGLSPEIYVQKWQHRLNPVWKRLAGGCNLNRDMRSLILNSNFDIEKIENRYVKGPKFATYQYWGVAIKMGDLS